MKQGQLPRIGQAVDFVERLVRTGRLSQAEAARLCDATVTFAGDFFPGAIPAFRAALARRLSGARRAAYERPC